MTTTPPPGAALRGVLIYLAAVALFATMDASTKFLVGGLPVPQVMWARFAFHLLFVSAGLLAFGRRLPFRARAPRLQIVRSLCLGGCNLLFAAALVQVPLATTTAINFAGPVFTVALAAVWLREHVGWRRWMGVLVGLAGVMIVVRPGAGGVHPAALFALGSAAVFAAYAVLTRKLAGVDTPQTTIFQTGLWTTLVTSAVVPFVWVWPDARDWALLILVGVLGGTSHFLLVLAYDRAPASLIAPMGYVQMVFAALWGLLLFDEIPDAATFAGAVVIALGGVLVVSAETRGRAARRPAELKPAGVAPRPAGD